MPNKILDTALEFAGLYEIKANSVWSDRVKSDKLLILLKAIGFKPGMPYCMAYCKAMWKASGQDMTGLTLSVMLTYTNMKKHITLNPVPGAIFLMRHGNTSNGHAGLVISYDKSTSTLVTIEGNTSPSKATSVANDREGDGIFKKTRIVSFAKSSSQMYFLGFLNPKVV